MKSSSPTLNRQSYLLSYKTYNFGAPNSDCKMLIVTMDLMNVDQVFLYFNVLIVHCAKAVVGFPCMKAFGFLIDAMFR